MVVCHIKTGVLHVKTVTLVQRSPFTKFIQGQNKLFLVRFSLLPFLESVLGYLKAPTAAPDQRLNLCVYSL